MKTISEVMARDHDKIVGLINDFGKCIELEKQTLKKAYQTFTWELEKHIFTEEKVIFTKYEPEDEREGYEMIPQLMQEHNKIYKKLREMKKSIKSRGTCDFKEFKKIMIKHKDFEEKSVYPKLDQELDETTKKMIVNRIGEVKLTPNSLKNIKVKCSECDKKLGILSGYHHSKLGKKWLFCSECYDKIE
ncbi:MAG: hemerythrin domain-containing protein [Thermoplasmatales archaeon]|nr:MAG: hemerythrin domain-containing protein [Thermoplasmatales archaeon]